MAKLSIKGQPAVIAAPSYRRLFSLINLSSLSFVLRPLFRAQPSILPLAASYEKKLLKLLPKFTIFGRNKE